MSTASVAAESVRRRYRLRACGVCDLDAILASEGLRLTFYPLDETVKEVIYKSRSGQVWIAINSCIDRRSEQRVLIAHALGHHFLHIGNSLNQIVTEEHWSVKQENQADTFAYHLLVPNEELRTLVWISDVSYLADYYDVPYWFMEQRLELFTVGRLRLWQVG